MILSAVFVSCPKFSFHCGEAAPWYAFNKQMSMSHFHFYSHAHVYACNPFPSLIEYVKQMSVAYASLANVFVLSVIKFGQGTVLMTCLYFVLQWFLWVASKCPRPCVTFLPQWCLLWLLSDRTVIQWLSFWSVCSLGLRRYRGKFRGSTKCALFKESLKPHLKSFETGKKPQLILSWICWGILFTGVLFLVPMVFHICV